MANATFKTFDDSTPEDWKIIGAEFHKTQAMVADHVLYLLRSLSADDGGFPVSRLEHSLQTATRAARDGRDDEYVVCALVHDIGDTLAPGYLHPEIAAQLLKPHVSEANLFMVKHHGIFQGYHYFDKVGQDKNLREKFRDHPHFDHAVEFCAAYDQIAFDADYRSEPLEHFEPLLREFFAPKMAPAASAAG